MSYSISQHLKKPSYPAPYARPLDIRNGYRVLPTTNGHPKLGYKIDKFIHILNKRVHLSKSIAFRRLQLLVNDSQDSDDLYKKRKFKAISKLFLLVYRNKLRMKAFGLWHIRNFQEGRIVFERINYFLMRMALKNLSATSKIQRFKTALLYSSKKSRIYQQGIKARYFMAVCENILSQKNVPKALYKSFREWHLQSVLKKLSSLNEEQKDMVNRQKEVVSRLLQNCVKRNLRRAFHSLKIKSMDVDFVNHKLSYHLSIANFIEKISVPFLKHSLLLFPRANWNITQYDAASMLKMCYFMKKLQTFRNAKEKISCEKLRAIPIIENLVKKCTFMNKEFAFRKLMIHLQSNFKTDVNVEISIKKKVKDPKLALPLVNAIAKLVKREYLDLYVRLIEGMKKDDKPIIKIEIETGIKILRGVLSESYQSRQRQRIALYKWRRVIESERPKPVAKPKVDVEQRKKQTKLYKLKKAMNHLSTNRLNEAFQAIVEFVENKMNEPVVEVQEQQLQEEEAKTFINGEVPSSKKILLDFIKNQTMINAKLEQSYKKSLVMLQRSQQMRAFQTLIFKDQQRAQHNTQVLQRFFRKWEYKISFNNGMTTEYNNLLRILEGESNVITTEIQQLDQLRLEKAAIYLNLLEEVNSDLIEIVEPHEKELEGPEAQEALVEMAIRHKRTFSM